MCPRDQWTAKQMTWIRARVPMNFPWTREDRWSMAMHVSLFSTLFPLSFFPARDYNYPICYPTLFLFLFIFSSTFSEGANAVVVLKLKSLTRRCHSAVPLHCFPIMWDFGLKDGSSFSNVWAFTPNIPSSSSHCDWPGAFQGYRFDLSTLLGQWANVLQFASIAEFMWNYVLSVILQSYQNS